MNLQEQISRIHDMMGLNESNLPTQLRRRIEFDPEKILKELKQWTLRLYSSDKSKEKTTSEVFGNVTSDMMWDTDIYSHEQEDTLKKEEFFIKLKDYLEERFQNEIYDFYDSMFNSEDDEETYCFYKHSDRHMDMLKNRGFGDCVKGWYNFLSKYGHWFGDIDWNEVKQKMNSNPQTKILIKKPLENHKYEYYFSVLKVKK